MNDEFRQRRNQLIPIGTIEHHALRDMSVSAYDICERLLRVFDELMLRPEDFSFDSDFVMHLNMSVAKPFGLEVGEFRELGKWKEMLNMIDDCGGFCDDPGHITGWIFSALYWEHLSILPFASSWIYVDMLLVHYKFPRIELREHEIGRFLSALSGSGPPIYDGQTFFPMSFGTD